MLPKVSKYIGYFNETRYMYILIKDDDLFKIISENLNNVCKIQK